MPDPLTLSAWVLAATVEQELIRVEADDGYNVAFATRPLNRAEKAAKTRFPDLDAIVEVATGEGAITIDALYAAAVGALLVEIFGDEEGIEDEQVEVIALIAALTLLIGKPPKRYTRERDQAVPKVARLIQDSFKGGVLTILDEADRQGVDIKRWVRPSPPDVLTVLAGDIVDHPWQRVSERVVHEYQTPGRVLAGTTTRGELENFARATSQAGTVDRLHQANQAAMGMGRVETADNYTGDFLVAYASEILDGNTCGPCSSVDGTRYESLAEAREDYPNGVYVACQGGSRCRGTLVIVYDEPPDEDNPNDPAWQSAL